MFRRILSKFGLIDADGNQRPGTWTENLLARAAPIAKRHLERDSSLSTRDAVYLGIVDIEEKDGAPRVPTRDMERLVHFVRPWTDLLLKNDMLAPALQFESNDLAAPRRLLYAYCFAAETLREEANTVLASIERSFGSSRFSQARLLLNLFETDAHTRRNNEKNIFYEEMIFKLLSESGRGADPVTITVSRADDITGSEATANDSDDGHNGDGDGLVQATFSALAEQTGIRINILARHDAEVALWHDAQLGGDSDNPDRALLRTIPPRRWRPVGDFFERSVAESVRRQIVERGARRWIEGLVRSVYFVLLATGETGYEYLAFNFIEWTDKHFDSKGTRVLPHLHRLCAVEETALPDALRETLDTYFEDCRQRLVLPDADAVAAEINEICRLITAADLQTVPPGDYDLGGLVLDRCLGIEHPNIARALRLHRLT